jgi:hypothetical protein
VHQKLFPKNGKILEDNKESAQSRDLKKNAIKYLKHKKGEYSF